MMPRRMLPPKRLLPLRKALPAKPEGALAPMTICIAAIHRYIYSPPDILPPDFGTAIFTASDRMWTNTSVGIQYEPGGQGKFVRVTKNTMILAADEIDIHSETLQLLHPFASSTPTPTTSAIAGRYGELLNGVKSERAAKYAFGSTYGFTAEQFARLQGSMDSAVVARLDQDMQAYEQRIGAEAIVAGCDDDNTCHIYHVDHHGIVHCYDDIGFFCIGAGRGQANAEFVQRSYSNLWTYYHALLLIYGAKKAAETAPGVGPTTDIHLITRGGAGPVGADLLSDVDRVYQSYIQQRKNLEQAALADLAAAEQKRHAAVATTASSAASAPVQCSPASQIPQAVSEEPSGEKPGETPPPSPPPQSPPPSQ